MRYQRLKLYSRYILEDTIFNKKKKSNLGLNVKILKRRQKHSLFKGLNLGNLIKIWVKINCDSLKYTQLLSYKILRFRKSCYSHSNYFDISTQYYLKHISILISKTYDFQICKIILLWENTIVCRFLGPDPCPSKGELADFCCDIRTEYLGDLSNLSI